MGCDIHEFYEIQQPDGRWLTHEYSDKYVDGDYDKLTGDPLYIGRCYDFFAFLAGVRNGIGFAGCNTGDVLTPISAPKGVPEDASDLYRGELEAWDTDGHSHSWHTGKGLMEADWEQTRSDALKHYHENWLPAVLALHEDPEKVRVCFFFDN